MTILPCFSAPQITCPCPMSLVAILTVHQTIATLWQISGGSFLKDNLQNSEPHYTKPCETG